MKNPSPHFLFIYLIIGLINTSLAQVDSTKNKLTFSGYLETYYSYDGSRPKSPAIKAPYIYNHKRHNEVDINLALLKVSYNDSSTRANLGIMAGSYAQFNLAAEPTWAQFIYEANVGVKLSKRKKLWLDVGILPSHIGFETAIGATNATLTRSLAADNSPYFETGARLSITSDDDKWSINVNYLNGWQRIRKPEGQSGNAFGIQATYKPNEKLSLNLSNYVGVDGIGNDEQSRVFHDFYFLYTPNERFGLIGGLDFGLQEKGFNSPDRKTWYTPQIVGRFKLAEKSFFAARFELYKDASNVIAFPQDLNIEQIIGISFNYDYNINKNFMFRTEIKQYFDDIGDESIFDQTVTNNTSFTMALCGTF